VRRLVNWEDPALYTPEDATMLRALADTPNPAHGPGGD
jgi:hypothetical protein